MKLNDFIYYMLSVMYVLVLGILWGAYIEGAKIPLVALILSTVCIIGWSIKVFFEIKE